jgi:hypothetical protein
LNAQFDGHEVKKKKTPQKEEMSADYSKSAAPATAPIRPIAKVLTVWREVAALLLLLLFPLLSVAVAAPGVLDDETVTRPDPVRVGVEEAEE